MKLYKDELQKKFRHALIEEGGDPKVCLFEIPGGVNINSLMDKLDHSIRMKFKLEDSFKNIKEQMEDNSRRMRGKLEVNARNLND